MQNLFDTLKNILSEDKRFVTEKGEILRNAVYEAGMKMDKSLLKMLLSNAATKEKFFQEVELDGNKTLVFDKVGFGWVVSNKEFLPDSYTRYKNKIGLVDGNDQYISNSNDVELVFPYKDCVLVGGQTKEEQKRNEIFFNKTLAPDEVDRLLAPKVLVNAKRYTKDGVEQIAEFKDSDNLIIKGNNLLALESLLARYEGKVKCIYIDVPYNTGNDSFGYNDKFNHSTWLTFMSNRLNLARKLLGKEGTIAISVYNYEIGYLLVLLDEIFGKENRKNIITVRRASASGAKVINPGVVNILEYIIIYSKNTFQWNPNRIYASKRFDERYNGFIENISEEYKKWKFTTLLEAFAKSVGVKKSQLKKHFGDEYSFELEKFALKNADSVFQFATLSDDAISQEARIYKKKSIENCDEVFFMERPGKNPYYLLGGKVILFAKDRVIEVDGQKTFSQPATDIWDDVLPNDLHNEGGVEFKKGKKPEKLIDRILDLTTNPGDLVVDFFAGSGTTGAVSIKKGRRFILCEQMDYVERTTKERLRNVLNGENRGVSQSNGWQGGGSFVYCELAQLNQKYVDALQEAETDAKVTDILKAVLATGFISDKVNPKLIDTEAEDYKDLSLDEKKAFVMEVLDSNLLYVNYSDIDDKEFAISDADKAFTKSFYGEE